MADAKLSELAAQAEIMLTICSGMLDRYAGTKCPDADMVEAASTGSKHLAGELRKATGREG